MDALKYVSLAISKDETRYSLTSVYRGKNHLVATDGHRLHLSNSLPDATPHFLNGMDGEFPDYEQLIPRGEPIGKANVFSIGRSKNWKETLNELKMISKLVKSKDTACSIEIHFEDGKDVRIKSLSSSLVFKFEYSISTFTYEGKNIVTGVNLSYLVDALSFLPEQSGVLKLYSELGPIRIDSANGLTAIVMPQRIK